MPPPYIHTTTLYQPHLLSPTIMSQKDASCEKRFIAAQLRAKASLGLTIAKTRQPELVDVCIDQIDNPHSEFNRKTIYKMISMLSNQSKADIFNILSEINVKLDKNSKLNWGEEMTYIAIKTIIKSRDPKQEFVLPQSILSPSWPEEKKSDSDKKLLPQCQ